MDLAGNAEHLTILTAYLTDYLTALKGSVYIDFSGCSLSLKIPLCRLTLKEEDAFNVGGDGCLKCVSVLFY